MAEQQQQNDTKQALEKPGDQQLPFKKFDTPRKIIDDLKYPWGIAVNKRGEIIVSLYGEYIVSLSSVQVERGFEHLACTQGSAEGQFTYPRGVAVNVDDDILVVDEGNHRIQKFTSNGQFIAAVGSIGNKPLQFNYPTGISVNPNNKKVYVTEWSMIIVFKFSTLT